MRSFQPPTPAIWAVLAPGVIVYGLVVLVPLLGGVWYSLHNMRYFQLTWAGLDNYMRALGDGDLWFTLRNNLIIIALSMVFQIFVAFFIAVLMNSRQVLAPRFLQTAIFFPVVISPVVTSFVWVLVYNIDSGLLNATLRLIGLSSWQQHWLDDPDIVIYSVSAVLIWQYVGLYMVIFLAGLSSINPETLEAAEVDGANTWEKAMLIIFPQLSGTWAVVLVLAISGGLKIFEHPFVMTGGGPGLASTVVAQYAYDQSFRRAQFGYGTAIAIAITVLGLVTILISVGLLNKLTRRNLTS